MAVFGAVFLISQNNKQYGQAISVARADVVDDTAPTHHSTSMSVETYDGYFNGIPSVQKIDDVVVSAVVPHHMVAGKYVANFFNRISWQKPPVVVLIGPNHPQAGKRSIITGVQPWRTPYGLLSVDGDAIVSVINRSSGPLSADIKTERDLPLAAIDDKTLGEENSIGAVVPFIKKVWPDTKLMPFIFKDTVTRQEIDELIDQLRSVLPKGSIVLTSVDFSHYLPEPVASFHDELSYNVLATGDISRLNRLEVDSEPSLYFLLSYNNSVQAEQFHLASHTNSALISANPNLAETTSHIIGYYTNGAPTEKPLTSLQFFGDIMIDRNVAKAMGSQGLDYVFKNLKGQENRFFKGADLFIANLEGPFAPSRIQTSKSIAFRFDPVWAPQLKKYNFNIVSLANNHTYDMGVKNIGYTRSLLAKNNIGYFGDQLREGTAYTWFATNTPETIAFVGVENVTHEPDKTALKKALDDARAKAKYVIVFPHMGTEYKQISNTAQRNLYHWLIDNGADAVVAAHPHVVEESEVYKGKPIFYSLGNFIFDQYFSKETQEGLSIGLTLQDGKVKNVYYFPMYSVKSQNYLMNGKRREAFLKWMGESSRLGDKIIENGKINL